VAQLNNPRESQLKLLGSCMQVAKLARQERLRELLEKEALAYEAELNAKNLSLVGVGVLESPWRASGVHCVHQLRSVATATTDLPIILLSACE
jgi:hypothetical protein